MVLLSEPRLSLPRDTLGLSERLRLEPPLELLRLLSEDLLLDREEDRSLLPLEERDDEPRSPPPLPPRLPPPPPLPSRSAKADPAKRAPANIVARADSRKNL